jgi:hypothetical protein
MIRAPFCLDKTEHKAEQGAIAYRSKLHATAKHRPQIVPSAKGLSPVQGLPPVRCPLRVEFSPETRAQARPIFEWARFSWRVIGCAGIKHEQTGLGYSNRPDHVQRWFSGEASRLSSHC